MSTPKSRASARVTLTIEVSTHGVWGGECSLAQIHDQAGAEARGALRNRLVGVSWALIGEPKVVAVIVEEEP